jgi:CheY-like chemotaxis protein
MDIQMPEMDGLETTEFIRNSGASFARIPIIALTASALVSEKSKCFEAGMDDYLSKPFKAEELFEKVSSWSKIV